MNRTELSRIVLETIVLIAFGALVGLSLNYQLVLDAFAGRLVPPERSTIAEETATRLPVPVLLDELPAMLEEKALLVDARSPELYAEGHLPGAVSLPLVEIDATLPIFLTDVEKKTPLILYCSGFGCPDSFDLGLLLIAEGYVDVRVFEGGYPEWRDSGRTVVGGVE